MYVIIEVDGLKESSISCYDRISFTRDGVFWYVSDGLNISERVNDALLFHVLNTHTGQELSMSGRELLKCFFKDEIYFNHVVPRKYMSFAKLFATWEDYGKFINVVRLLQSPKIEIKEGVVRINEPFRVSIKFSITCSAEVFIREYAKFLLLCDKFD